MIRNSNSSSSFWSRIEDKQFERALVVYPEGTPDRWHKISGQVPGKSWMEVKKHYEDLVYDVREIDSGRVELPSYEEDELNSCGWGSGTESGPSRVWFGGKGKEKETTERRKGVPWTEEEHRLFLIGLQRYGKGDWRSISRNAVVSRTPTQVASHAQKYFLRLNSVKKEKKRPSIHDITPNGTSTSTSTSEPDWNPSSFHDFGFHM
ncbi:transcription factor SRM1-like [Euphorbia lathyris]|uniref:transcription factor SRM1-like n=1 Tax=Euphorbia lathyris TaxID=212925 RepID=UPI0033141698